MKKKTIFIVISIIIILSVAISSCDFKKSPSSPGDTTDVGASDSKDQKIAELEAQIIALMQSQQLSDTERRKEIAALEAKIEALKKSPNASETDAPQNETQQLQSFRYTLDNGRAIILEISAQGESVTIPSYIDGYSVFAVGSYALSSSSVKSVTVSDGVEKLDWFAFSGCIALSSIHLPSSITAIGYGAFDNTSSSLTIHCPRDSFAHKYAQSYGITYDIK